ncbi:hypothetical protein POM88_001126 [Heracleum sosnowskyi]|uniref:DUF4283 domain-containing protein n=1 Tax=Heracleum sosnowskyi TaxID=360622 RepID=A0AAD8NAG4_9APIA|nr:hypothetical protein POM88_001126 [Heracleum sosnowskyi]
MVSQGSNCDSDFVPDFMQDIGANSDDDLRAQREISDFPLLMTTSGKEGVRPSSLGNIPVVVTDNESSEDENDAPFSDKEIEDLERNTVNPAVKAAFAINKDERNELFALRLKLQELDQFLKKKGLSMARVEEEVELLKVDFNRGAGVHDSSCFVLGRDDFGLPILKKPSITVPEISPEKGSKQGDGSSSGIKNDKGKAVANEVFDNSLQNEVKEDTKGYGKLEETCLKSILKKPKSATSINEDNGSIEKEDGHSQGKSWAKVVRGPPPVSNSLKLEYLPLPKGVSVVCPPDDVLQKGLDKFKNCAVGMFSKNHPPFKIVHDHALNSWSKFGLLDVFQKDSNVFIFKFNSEIDLHNFIARGTLYIGKSPMLLSAWGTNPCISPITSMPLWIKISKIPDCYWTSTGLSSIASVVGNPLGADELTSKLDVLPFAKVCVQYEIGAALPSKIPVMAINPCTGVKEEVDVLISYPIKPLVCTSCKSLGHSIAACPVTKRVWVEKKKQPPVET